jgi:Ribbon-helix-helix protein, copG family
MKISIDFDENLIATIDRAAAVQKISRDAAFREALETWVAHKPQSAGSSLDFSRWEFDPDFIPFEVHRPGPEAMPEFRPRKPD